MAGYSAAGSGGTAIHHGFAMRYVRYLPALAVIAVVCLAVAIVLALVMSLGDKPRTAPVRIQQVSLLPPPPIEKPPEPEIKKETPMDQVDAPKDSTDNTPAGDELGVDADGNGADNFGLKAIKGGHGLLDGGPFGRYSAALRSDVHDWIARDKRLRRERYAVVLRLWIAGSGRIDRAELAGSTGNGELDQRLRAMMVGLVGKVREPPPQEMPQPVRLAVRSQM